MRKPAALLCLLACSPGYAAELPEQLRCRLTGGAGCAEDGICVGGGVRNSTVRLSVDTRKRLLVLNGIEGRLWGEEALVASELREVIWQHSLIGLDQLEIRRRDERGFILQLRNRPTDGGSSQVEFTCRG